MKIIESKSGLDRITKGQVLSIGNFDGLHLGHREIIKVAKQTAHQWGTKFAVMTFFPHPAAILHPEETPGVLTPLPLKKRLLEEAGADTLIVLKDSPELLNLSPQGFVDEFLMKNVRPCVVVEGENFHFGCVRAGNVRTLQHLGAEHGFEVLIVPARRIQFEPGRSAIVSSTLIRTLLQKGDVRHAADALGRPYRLIGQVVPGHGKGAALGFPTANLAPANQILPAEGVYAGLVRIADAQQELCCQKSGVPAAFSIGRAATYGTEQSLLIEAHLLTETVGALYDRWMAMDFVQRIRRQQKFETEKKLAEQITKDCQNAKEILAT